tara:strand:+ start:2478 stop:3041 length:564 start_codon:yes stop_codon:yes gene_type:complete
MSELDKFPSSFVSEQFETYMEEKDIENLTGSLAHTISQRFENEELVVIGLLKGSMMFMSDLLKQIKNVKVTVEFVKLKPLERSKENSGTIIIEKDIQTSVAGKNVLIVTQIIDSARSLDFLKRRLTLNNPRCVEILTLFDKPYNRAVPLKPDYIGKQIEDKFIVGYGNDLDDFGRNIKTLYYLKYPN